jgi:flagellar export protein FliJ
MKPFRFNLQVVRTLRQRREQQMMQRYALSLRAQRQAVVRLQLVQHELESAWRQWHATLLAGCPAAATTQAQRFFEVLEARRQDCLAAVRQSEQELQAALQAMLTARQEREAVDVFFDHQRQQHDRALQQEERKALDEMARGRGASVMLWSLAKPVSHD